MIESEVRAVASRLGRFPTKTELEKSGRADLSVAISRNGGFAEWIRRTGLQGARPPRIAWTDSMIERELLKVITDTGRFPSSASLRQTGQCRLASVVASTKGFFGWAEYLGVPRNHSDSDTGWEGERKVKAILEEKGFKATRTEATNAPYDLLVNDRVRVDVKTARQVAYQQVAGNDWAAWHYRIGKRVPADVVILYQADTKACYVLPWWEVGHTNITISANSAKYARFKQAFHLITSMAQASKSITY